MNKTLLSIILGMVIGPMTASAQPLPPPDTYNYRAKADVQLQLVFQGIAEGGISRSLRLFGGTGTCEAWYAITEVNAAPSDMNIQSGDRLKLDYRCGKDRAYVPGQSEQQSWAEENGPTAQATIFSGDMHLDRANTWEIPNLNNVLAPVAVQLQK